MDATEVMQSLAQLPNGFFSHVSSTGGAMRATFGAPKPGQRQPVVFSAVGQTASDAMTAALQGLMIQLEP
jgi:hypothetical protein